MSPSRSIIRSSLGCKAEKGFPGRPLCSNEDLPSMNFSLSSKPRCNLRYPSSPMVSLKHVHPYAYGQFPLSLLASIRFYPILFHCIRLSYESFIPKWGRHPGSPVPLYLQIHATDGFPSIKELYPRQIAGDRVLCYQTFLVKRVTRALCF